MLQYNYENASTSQTIWQNCFSSHNIYSKCVIFTWNTIRCKQLDGLSSSTYSKLNIILPVER